MINTEMTNLTKILNDLVAVDSQYPREFLIYTYLENLLKENGFTVHKQKVDERRYNLFAKRGNADKFVCFYGHMDTVHIEETSKWKTDPFSLTQKGNKLFGLGAYDMKGGISAFFSAALRTNSAIKMFFAVDEENISSGAWKAVNENKSFFSDVELIISAEPSFEYGVNSITTGRVGRCIYEGVVEGRAVHIADHRNGVDAIAKTAELVNKFYKKRSSMARSNNTVLQIRKIFSEANGMSVSGFADLEIEALISPPDTIGSILSKVRSQLGIDVKVKGRSTPYLEAYRFDDHPHKDLIGSLIKKHTGKNVKHIYRSSVGDDNVLASLGTPVITWGPEGGNAHRSDEYVDLRSLRTLEKMFSEFIKLYCLS